MIPVLIDSTSRVCGELTNPSGEYNNYKVLIKSFLIYSEIRIIKNKVFTQLKFMFLEMLVILYIVSTFSHFHYLQCNIVQSGLIRVVNYPAIS